MKKPQEIKLKKVTPDELASVIGRIETYDGLIRKDKESNGMDILSFLSLLEELRTKLWKKYISKRNKENFNLTLKYYEGYALWMVLTHIELNYNAQYILFQLDQKLAQTKSSK